MIGESLVDIVETRDGKVFEAPGGSPLNVAVTLGRLGIETHLLTALGDDERADGIEAHLTDSDVTLMDGVRRLSRTSTATATIQTDGSAHYEFAIAWDPPDSAAPLVGVVHAGSLGLFVEPGSSNVRRRLEAATASTLVTLDPNIRPSLLPGRAAVLTHYEELLALAHVVKLSDDDAAWLYPELSEREVSRRVLDRGPALVVITRGAHGCVLASRGAFVELPSAPADVVDTIGAGDSFMGALIQQFIRRGVAGDLVDRASLWPEELAAIGGVAADVAAITVGRRGADPPRISDLAVRPPG